MGVALFAAGISSMVYAQSSVTFYGIVDPAIVFVNNAQINKAGGQLHGAHQYSLQDATTSAYAGSRFGLKGTEDLGGGTNAVFVLENGFNAATGALGQGGLLFGRQAFVGVSNSSLGSVTLGRQYSSMIDFISPMTAVSQWGGFISAHPDDVDNLGLTNRQNNTIKLTSPSWSGATVNVTYGFGGVAGHTAQNQVVTVGAGYVGGPLRLGVAFVNAFNPNISIWGTSGNAGGTDVNNMGSFGSAATPQKNPVMAGYASAHRQQVLGAAAGYTFRSATLDLIYTNTRFIGLGSASGPNPLGYAGGVTFNSVEANGAYRITPAISVGVAYTYTWVDGPDMHTAHYHQVNAGVHYALSKRTDVYMVAAFQRASGVDSLGQPAVASINGMTPSASRRQVVDTIGLAHRF
ncbi:porin [Paraburkholderia sp. SIMBA_049]